MGDNFIYSSARAIPYLLACKKQSQAGTIGNRERLVCRCLYLYLCLRRKVFNLKTLIVLLWILLSGGVGR